MTARIRLTIGRIDSQHPELARRLTVPSVPVRVLDPTTFTEEPAQRGGLPAKPALPVDLDYSADGRLLAVSLDNYARRGTLPLSTWVAQSSSVMVWDLEAPELLIVHLDVATVFNAVALGPDGRSLYVGRTGVDNAPSVTVYDIGSGQPLRGFGGPGFPLEVSPDGTLLASANGADIVLFDAATGQERRRLRGHTAAVTNLRFSGDGLLASVSDDRSAIVWDLASGQRREQLRGHAGAARGLGFGRDDATLYTRHRPKAAGLGHTRRPQVHSPPSHSRARSDRQRANPRRPNRRCHRLRLDRDRRRRNPPRPASPRRPRHPPNQVRSSTPATSPLRKMSWRPDGALLATAGQDGSVRVRDGRTRDLLGERRVTDAPAAGLDYTGDGERIVVADPSGSISTIDGDTLEPDGTAVQIGGRIVRVDASPDNRTVIALTGGLASFSQLTESIEASPNSGFAPSTWVPVACWSAATARGRRPGRPVRSRLLARRSSGRGRQQWRLGQRPRDVHTGEPAPAATIGHDDLVLRVAFAPDGTKFVSAGIDGRVALWDGHNGESLGIVPADQRNSPAAAAFLPDGHSVLITSYDGSVHTWDTGPRHWIECACAVAGRNLTPAEWRVHFAERPYRETCAAR